MCCGGHQSPTPCPGVLRKLQEHCSKFLCHVDVKNFQANCVLQSEEVPNVDTSVVANDGYELDQQTVTFVDNEQGVVHGAAPNGNQVAEVDNTDDINLGAFLARPTLISSLTWTTSTVVSNLASIKPWALFLSDTRITKKIDNYAFLRGNLHIKVVLNGTPFQYGLLRMAYSPLLGLVSDKITIPTPFVPALVPYSQQPGIYLQPQANAGGEMVLPFFYHKNWLDITNLTDVENMGTLNFIVYNPLQTAVTGGTTSVSIKVYAWMDDVQLMGSTSKLALQGDEYGTGIISRPASALASIADSLSKVPFIGKFARATSIGASAVSSIATLFGYTNVPVIDAVHNMAPMNGPILASAHIGSAVQKLALDPKQELSIDPSPHGLPAADELSLSYLKAKESWFAATTWSTADTTDTQIFNCRVNPRLISGLSINNASAVEVGKQVYHVPLSYIGEMFRHWRGDIIIRIKVVCTKFHKGRLKISYDPRNNISITNPSENSVYTEILDIGEQNDIEIRIPYHQAYAWLDTDRGMTDNWTLGNSLAPRDGVDNGMLTIRVLTTLTAPVSGLVYLNFFVRGAENFEYANPADHIGCDSEFEIPSFFALQAEDSVDLVPVKVQMGANTTTSINRYDQNFGECVGSLRNYLHRYSTLDNIPLFRTTSSAVAQFYRKDLLRMPYTPGYVPSWPVDAQNVVASSGHSPYAYNTMHPLPWVAGLFMGYRGGVNFNVTGHTDKYGFLDDFRVTRNTRVLASTIDRRRLSFVAFNVASTLLSALDSNFGRAQYTEDGTAGVAITSNRTNASINFNLPDFNNFNFSLVDPTIYPIGSSIDGSDKQFAKLQFVLRNLGTTTTADTPLIGIHVAQAAGVDFTCLYFMCCPTVFYKKTTPAAA